MFPETLNIIYRRLKLREPKTLITSTKQISSVRNVKDRVLKLSLSGRTLRRFLVQLRERKRRQTKRNTPRPGKERSHATQTATHRATRNTKDLQRLLEASNLRDSEQSRATDQRDNTSDTTQNRCLAGIRWVRGLLRGC